ncbi:glucoside xylosyltransferase 1 [Teleopsis dalmanni]|uniref:glucoside xylosyltransferase 1 n=1 Tax=Teleopsis dalmanni TaxID=139649 RepID=UPI0018CFA65C|nr:glucoside xylosyltransferase 1 [Teleopsis dalmanni]
MFSSKYVFCILVVTTTVLIYVLYQNLKENESPVTILSRKTTISNALHIAVVACGQRLEETLVMIKSALLYNEPTQLLKFLIFTEDKLFDAFREKLSDWQALQMFEFEILPLRFPSNQKEEWYSLFKPCAAQRLFLPTLLSDVDSILYVDTDILFFSPVSDIWDFFNRFNSTQLAALVAEHEDSNIGWYNRFARHPYYGKLGVNSGVMLMNLTRMRTFGWNEKILPIYKEYKLRITWGDQDIINILFYYHPEKLYLMPCNYNYRADHCMYMNVCDISKNGVKILHGNRGYFHSAKQPFRILYSSIQSLQLKNSPYQNFVLPMQEAMVDSHLFESNCGKVLKGLLSKTVNDLDYAT